MAGNFPTAKRSFNARWYDSRPPVKESMEQIWMFPESIRIPITDGALALADLRYKADSAIQNLKSVGSTQVIALYKTNKKQRQIDTCSRMFRLYRYLLILAPEIGDELSSQTLRMMRTVVRYLRICRSNQYMPKMNIIQDLIDVFVFRGDFAAAAILTELEHTTDKPLDSLDDLQTFRALTDGFLEDKLITVNHK